jgi:RNA polymerase sigma factor (sigma-70 family)
MAAVRESTKDRVAAVEPVVRRVLASKVYDPNRLDDLVQETLTRLASSRRDLDGEALVAYAIVSARNLLASDSARSSRRGALQHRLANTRQPEQPEVTVMAGERRTALRTALDSLSEAERSAVLAHEVEGVDTATIAADQRSTPRGCRRPAGARSSQAPGGLPGGVPASPPAHEGLSQRSGVSFRGGPTPPVQPRSRRPRARLPKLRRAGAHAGGTPAPTLGPHPRRGPRAGTTGRRQEERVPLRSGNGRSGHGWGGRRGGDRHEPGAGVAPGRRRFPGRRRCPADLSGSGHHRWAGFWIACGQARVWLRLVGAGESPRATRPGASVDFRATSARHGPGFAAGQGVDPAEGGVELDGQAFHLGVAYSDLKP